LIILEAFFLKYLILPFVLYLSSARPDAGSHTKGVSGYTYST
jgi:hypothetical protein